MHFGFVLVVGGKHFNQDAHAHYLEKPGALQNERLCEIASTWLLHFTSTQRSGTREKATPKKRRASSSPPVSPEKNAKDSLNILKQIRDELVGRPVTVAWQPQAARSGSAPHSTTVTVFDILVQYQHPYPTRKDRLLSISIDDVSHGSVVPMTVSAASMTPRSSTEMAGYMSPLPSNSVSSPWVPRT